MASDPGWWRVAEDDVDARERVEGVAVRVDVLLLAVAGMVVALVVVAVVVAVAVMVVVVVGECAAKAGCVGASAGS